MKRIIILKSEQDLWEACYVDGKSVSQAHHIERIEFLKCICRIYNTTLDDVTEVYATEVDDNNAMDYGSFPDFLSELQGEYNFQ